MWFMIWHNVKVRQKHSLIHIKLTKIHLKWKCKVALIWHDFCAKCGNNAEVTHHLVSRHVYFRLVLSAPSKRLMQIDMRLSLLSLCESLFQLMNAKRNNVNCTDRIDRNSYNYENATSATGKSSLACNYRNQYWGTGELLPSRYNT